MKDVRSKEKARASPSGTAKKANASVNQWALELGKAWGLTLAKPLVQEWASRWANAWAHVKALQWGLETVILRADGWAFP